MLGDDTHLKLRPIESEVSLLGNCDGSARVRQGSTSVLVGIWGPVEVRQSRELPDKATLEVSVKYCTGQGTPRDTYSEDVVASVCREVILLSEHPRTSIQVNVQVESDDGSVLAVTANALCLALMDAGLPLRSQFAAVCCVTTPTTNDTDTTPTVTWDPTCEEEGDDTTARYLFVYDSDSRNVIFSNYTGGQCEVREYLLYLQKGRQLANQIFSYFRESFEKFLRKDVKFQLLLSESDKVKGNGP